MKLLVLLPESPFPWAHTASRYYGPLLRELDRQGHDVTALAIGSDVDVRNQPARYFAGTGIDLRFLPQPAPAPYLERKIRSAWRSGWELSRSSFGRTARELADGPFDVVLAEQLSTARAVEGRENVVCTLHALRHLDIGPDTGSPADRLRAMQIKREETTGLRAIRRVRALTETLARNVVSLAPDAETIVVPLCIDPRLYEPVSPPPVPTVGVIGSMFWPPSREAARTFIENLVPALRARRSDLRFLVAGWRATRYLAEAAGPAGVELIDDFESPAEIFARLSVLVYLPPAGTGMKVKVLEAMAFGVPVVTNEHGVEGLYPIGESGVHVAKSDADACEAIVALLDDRPRRNAAIDAGRACVEGPLSPQRVVPTLVERLTELVAGAAHA